MKRKCENCCYNCNGKEVCEYYCPAYEDIDDLMIDRIIEEDKEDFYHQWQIYTSCND